MTVFIHHKQSPNLATLLVQLQPQLSPDDDIYIVDSSPDKSGLKIVQLYGSTRCYIFVEVGDYSTEQAYDFAHESMVQNHQTGLLSIDENCVISSTLISNLKKVKGLGAVSPVVIKTPYPQMPTNFKWYNPTSQNIRESKTISFKCNFITGEDTSLMGLLSNETVVVLPL